MTDRKIDWTIIALGFLLLGPAIAVGRKDGFAWTFWVALVLGICAHVPGVAFALVIIWLEEIKKLGE